jgi:hypothetical protein
MLPVAVVSAALSITAPLHAQTTQPSAVQIRDGANTWLVEQLASDEPATRIAAEAELESRGDAARADLEAALKSDSPAARKSARALLDKLGWAQPGDPPLVRGLLGQYGKSNAEARLFAIQSMVNMNAAAAPALLRTLLRETDEELLWEAIDLLDTTQPGDHRDLFKSLDTAELSAPLLYLSAKGNYDNADEFHRRLRLCVERTTSTNHYHPLNAVAVLSVAAEHAGDIDEQFRLAREGIRLHAEQVRVDPLIKLIVLHARHPGRTDLSDDLTFVSDDLRKSSRAVKLSLSWLASVGPADLQKRIGSASLDDLLMEPVVHSDEGDDELNDTLASIYSLRLANAQELAELELTRLLADDKTSAEQAYSARVYLYQIAKDRRDHAACVEHLNELDTLVKANGFDHIDWYRAELLAHRALEAHARDDRAGFDAAVAALSQEPNRTNAVMQIVPTLDAMDRRDEADRLIDLALEPVFEIQKNSEDFDPQPCNTIAWTLGRTGRRLDVAHEQALKANRLQPGTTAYIDTLAEIEHRLGNQSEAVRLETIAVLAADDQVDFMWGQLVRFRAGLNPGDRDKALPPE